MRKWTVIFGISFCLFALNAYADEGLADHTMGSKSAALPLSAAVPGPMPEDKQLVPLPNEKKSEQPPLMLPLNPQMEEERQQLDVVQDRLKAGGLSDKERFDLQLKQAELRKKLETPH